MDRRAKPKMGKAERKRPLSSKPTTGAGVKVVEERLAEALKREAEALELLQA